MKVFGTDYDGVIINIEPEKAKAFGLLLHNAWGVDVDDAVEYWVVNAGKSRRSHFDSVYQQRFGRELTDDEYQKIEGGFSDLLRTKFYPQVQLLPGAIELLEYARSNFELTFVSSGVPMEEIKYLVRLNGVANYFDVILGTNSEYPSKREHLQKIIEEQKPDQLVFVADGLEDMRVAKEFEVISIAVTTNRSEAELREAGATYIATLGGVIPILKSL